MWVDDAGNIYPEDRINYETDTYGSPWVYTADRGVVLVHQAGAVPVSAWAAGARSGFFDRAGNLYPAGQVYPHNGRLWFDYFEDGGYHQIEIFKDAVLPWQEDVTFNPNSVPALPDPNTTLTLPQMKYVVAHPERFHLYGSPRWVFEWSDWNRDEPKKYWHLTGWQGEFVGPNSAWKNWGQPILTFIAIVVAGEFLLTDPELALAAEGGEVAEVGIGFELAPEAGAEFGTGLIDAGLPEFTEIIGEGIAETLPEVLPETLPELVAEPIAEIGASELPALVEPVAEVAGAGTAATGAGFTLPGWASAALPLVNRLIDHGKQPPRAGAPVTPVDTRSASAQTDLASLLKVAAAAAAIAFFT